ncbi:hypothetical protein AVEN_271511-1 [Araneus ventricosus]|uniref:Uncharacterized protein n=1 Tax=Araneus ventricosus TaxID=182803 RepID=A0A4Y2FZW6_ARAVE|nr:hypothetical protein AVEN_271511-1 [Araneus ventricosus]
MKTLSAEISVRKNESIDDLISRYSTLKSFAEIIDEKLCFLMFCNVLLTATTVYYTLTIISHNGLSFNFAVLLCLCWNSVTSFVAQTTAATAFAESSMEIWRLINSHDHKQDSLFVRDRQVSSINVEQEIYFTVWKIVPIKRSFIFGTFGTIITYVMLFNSIDTATCSRH